MPWEKSFDVDEALGAAVEAFWAKGYEATSLNDLLSAMDIRKGSFYDTFSSKHETLLSALDRYTEDRLRRFEAGSKPEDPLGTVREHVREVLKLNTSDTCEPGCMLLNVAMEMASRDGAVRRRVDAALRSHLSFIEDCLKAASDRGDLEPSANPGRTAAGVFGLVLGMSAGARSGLPKAVIRSFADAAESLLDAADAKYRAQRKG